MTAGGNGGHPPACGQQAAGQSEVGDGVGDGWGQSPPTPLNPVYSRVTPPLISPATFSNLDFHSKIHYPVVPYVSVPYTAYRDIRATVQCTRQIPGVGEKTSDKDISKATCGSVRAWVGCSKDKGHKATPLKNCCNNVECPECWSGWAIKQARITSEKLRGYVKAAQPEGFIHEQPEQCFSYFNEDGTSWVIGHKENAVNIRHLMVSPKPGSIPPNMSTDMIMSTGKMWCKFVGIRGGMMVFHPWRILPDIKDRLTGAIAWEKWESKEDYEKKHWQAVRENLLKLEDWTAYVYWSPHFHIIGFGFICDSVNFNRLTGGIVSEIRNVNLRKEWNGQKMRDDVAALAYYVLSHCSVEWGKKSVIWIGCMTPTNLKRMQEQPVVEVYQKECPDCKADQMHYCCGDDAPGDPLIGRDGEWKRAVHTETLYRYHIVTGGEKIARREQRAKRLCGLQT